MNVAQPQAPFRLHRRRSKTIQRLITLGCVADLALDVAELFGDSSGSSLTMTLALGLVPVAAVLFQLCRRLTAEADDMAEFRVETIHR
jgi:hypothetical protein